MSAKEMRELSISSSRVAKREEVTYQYILKEIEKQAKKAKFYVSMIIKEHEDHITYEDWLKLDGYSVKTKYLSGDGVIMHIDWFLTEDEKKEPAQG